MQKPLSSNIAGYLKAHLQKKRWKQVVTVLACLVVFGTTYALILPAITMTGETFCGKQAHTHSVEAGCYTQGEPHVHTEDCYKEASVLTCGLAETEGHTHGESCYDEDSNLICGQEEAEAHTHTEACYTTQKTLVCGKEEGAAESALTCKLEEHAHTLACYSNPDADTVAPALPALSGNAAADAAAIAKAQLGYTESSKNYAVAPDGETTYGYTCYGAAYGNAYADDWSALFARYCLDKAGVSEAFPRADTCAGWLAALAAQELYRDAAGYAPKPGDVAFYDLDGDGAAEHTGIVLDAETAAVGDVNGKVEKEALTAAAGFGALPASGPKKAAAADTSKPTFELTFSGNSHGADDEWLFYTGETFKANVSLSDNAQDGEQTAADDGMVARIYMRFTKTVPPTGNTSVNGLPSVINSGTITANSGGTYTITVTRIGGLDLNQYTYCYDIQRPCNGDTLNIDLPCAFPSPDSAGGAVEIWGMILTKAEKEALDSGSTPGIQEPAEGEAVTARWETKPDDFTLSKTNATSSRMPYVSFDDDENPTITQLQYHVDVKRDTTETLEGIGKDFLVSVDYVDTLTLPANTHFDAEVIEAVKNGRYERGTIEQDYDDGGKTYCYYVTTDTKKPVFAITKNADDGVAIRFSEDRRSVSISWTQKNSKYTTSEYSGTSVGIRLPDIHIEKLEEGLDYTVCNNVTATYHYRWSEAVQRTAFRENKVSLGEAQMSYEKRQTAWASYGGTIIVYRISAENKGSMPFKKLAFIKDPLPYVLYMSAADMCKTFMDKTYGKGFSIEISHAAICEANNPTVKATDGSEAAATVTWVSPDDVEGKYSGMWTGKDPTVLTADASFKIGWNEEKTGLIISRLASEGVEAKSIPCKLTTEAIQTALDELGLFVTSKTIYQLQWDLRDENEQPKPVYNGHPVSIGFQCTNKNTFMLLTEDRLRQYADNYVYYYSNSADFEDTAGELLGRASNNNSSWASEISLYKSAAWPDGSAITDKNAPQNGDIVNYALTIKHSSNYISYYALLPVTDHMTGAQVLLAEKEKNASAGWAADCPTVKVDGTDYYKLSQEGTYSGVWLGEYYADTVTVSKTSAGRDTLIKWYFKKFGGAGTNTYVIRYKALVCPQELSVRDMTFTLDNESWLNDHPAHRLYDTIGIIPGSTISFDKKIVSESDVGAAQKEAGKTESSVSEGETVYYRIALHPAGGGSESEEADSVTLSGPNLRDSLPLGFRIADTNKFEWHKSENAEDKTPGSVWVVGYEGKTAVNGGWSIAAGSTKEQQEIVWDDDFSVTFPSNKPLYIYIRLTFPTDADWQDYAVQNNNRVPTNTFYLNGVGSAVTHTLKLEAKAYLQKGVYRNYYYNNNDYSDYVTHSDLTGYLNGKGVIYYVALCNDGNTRLYLTDMQDILPKGFRFDSLDPSGYKTWHPPVITTPTTALVMRKDNGCSYQFKLAKVECVEDNNDPQKLTFRFSPSSSASTSDISYDKARGLCYLNPGEAINFCYRALIGYTASTDEAATNGIAMPYYDYNLGGVSISDNALTLSGTTTDVDNPNDGSCRLVDNTQIASGGFTGVSNDTQWLYSEVTQYRSEIKPGISKRLAAAVSTNGAVTENPVAARPEDTLRWEVTVYNNGSTSLEDFTVTDVMQFPYKFDGTIWMHNEELISISLNGETGFVNGNGVEELQITVNGNEVRVEDRNSYIIYVRVTKDKATGNYALSIRFPAGIYSLSAGDTMLLTYETKRSDDNYENTVFVNTCYVTPSNAQNWDGTTNHGNVTTFDPNGEDENRLSVRNSAPVTTAYGFATSSLKTVELTDDPETAATGNDGANYITLPDTNTRKITYTLQVDAPEETPMTSLTLIDTLPYKDDHTSFQQDDLRFSEFAVDFAGNPNVTVTVTSDDGTTTLTADQYTVSYSNQTEFSLDDWRGTSKWNDSPTDMMRTLRVAITDKEAIPKKSHVAVRFNAVVSSDADYGQSAWNSFGYHYSVGTGPELEAAPLKVGVKMPTRPYLQKSLVDREGKSVIAKKDETFRFLLYSGKSLKTADEATIAEKANEVSVIDLTVLKGESVSAKKMLKDLKVWTYADGQWKKTDEDWTWTQNGSYTIIELPQSDDPEYRFQSLNRRTDATGYTFIYQNDQTQQISAVNRHDVWSLTIRKVDQTAQDLTIAGAWFALYSPKQADALEYDALRDKPTNKPAETIEQDGATWYLAQVAQTGNVESEQGSLTWSGLRRETYLYQEIQAPKGYKLDPAIRTITKTGYPQTVTVTNEGAGYELPQTGGPGVAPFLLSGGLIFGGTAFALLRRRKRKGAA